MEKGSGFSILLTCFIKNSPVCTPSISCGLDTRTLGKGFEERSHGMELGTLVARAEASTHSMRMPSRGWEQEMLQARMPGLVTGGELDPPGSPSPLDGGPCAEHSQPSQVARLQVPFLVLEAKTEPWGTTERGAQWEGRCPETWKNYVLPEGVPVSCERCWMSLWPFLGLYYCCCSVTQLCPTLPPHGL